MRSKKLLLTMAAVFCGALAIDQLLKLWAVKRLADGAVAVIPGVFEFVYTENRAGMWGLFSGLPRANVLLGVFASLLLIAAAAAVLKLRLFAGAFPSICMTLVLSGGLGNTIDRFVRGFVVDFAYFRLIDFPVFNFADACITCSLLAMILWSLFSKDAGAEEKKDQDGTAEG